MENEQTPRPTEGARPEGGERPRFGAGPAGDGGDRPRFGDGDRPRFGGGPGGGDGERPSRFGGGGGDRGDRPGGFRGGRGGGRRGGPPRRKQPIFADNEVVDYKDISRLRLAIDERGKILPRRKTHCSAGIQRQLTVAIKRARHLALLPFVPVDRRR
jgi:small subunit ribosomal protein S18